MRLERKWFNISFGPFDMRVIEYIGDVGEQRRARPGMCEVQLGSSWAVLFTRFYWE